jgi:SNF2 family DNA or RNA helicase
LTKKKIENNELTLLHKINWSRIIFDEAHNIRNVKTTRYKSAKLLSGNNRWLVSGTPIQNNKKDFYNLCNMINLPASYYTEKKNLVELTKSFILKRTKKQVGIKISDIHIDKNIVDWINPKEKKLSEELHSCLSFSNVNPEKGLNNKIISAIRNQGSLSLMLRAKQICIYPKLMSNEINKMIKQGLIIESLSDKEGLEYSSKLDAVVNDILKYKNNGNGKLIFCHFREEIDEIVNRLIAGGIKKIAFLDGRISNKERCKILKNKNEVLIIQIQIGCEGLNLQENYNEIFFLSPNWNPAVEDQAIARCHRIGQKKPVYVKQFVMSSFEKNNEIETKTIDKYIIDIQDCKRMISNELFAQNTSFTKNI